MTTHALNNVAPGESKDPISGSSFRTPHSSIPLPARSFLGFFAVSFPAKTSIFLQKTHGIPKIPDFSDKVLAVLSLSVNNARVKQHQWTGAREATGGLGASRGSQPDRTAFRLQRE
jgi:hypothetical protein